MVSLEYNGYAIDNAGNVYKHGKQLKHRVQKKDGKLYKSIRIFYASKKYKQLNIATLVATYFVKKLSTKNKYLIFKDRNTLNCHYTNLAWVDGQTFIYYSGIYDKKSALKKYSKDYAIANCIDAYVLKYYLTNNAEYLNVRFLQYECYFSSWHNWNELKSFCYLSIIDRVNRYSLLGNLKGFIFNYLNGEQLRVNKNLKMCNANLQRKF